MQFPAVVNHLLVTFTGMYNCSTRRIDWRQPGQEKIMAGKTSLWPFVGAATLIAAAAVFVTIKSESKPGPELNAGLITNHSFINGLYTSMDIFDEDEVFAYIFRNLDDEVTIFPSENYFYFRFSAQGQTLGGSLSLKVGKRDEGKISLGYSIKPESRDRQKYFSVKGGARDFGADDGVEVVKVDDFTYNVTYEERTVTFHLFETGHNPPQKAALTPDEEYVCSTFDESGLQFHLLFNKTIGKMYWILNEDAYVPEEFTRHSNTVFIGDRTEFFWFADSAYNRKVLIGVNGENVLHNNWYDGPFDQLADNYVNTGAVNMTSYIEAHYPMHKGNVDKFGRMLNREDARVPVAPYRVYWDTREFNKIDSLADAVKDHSALLEQLTAQIYYVPRDYYKNVLRKK